MKTKKTKPDPDYKQFCEDRDTINTEGLINGKPENVMFSGFFTSFLGGELTYCPSAICIKIYLRFMNVAQSDRLPTKRL